MSKRILTLVLIAAMLFLASCKVVEVIDHATTTPEETTAPTTPPQEYSPWGFWHSYDSSTAVELIENGSIAKLYSLTIGYYEYYHIGETTFTRDGDTFTVVWEEKTYVLYEISDNDYVVLSGLIANKYQRYSANPDDYVVDEIMRRYEPLAVSDYIDFRDIDFQETYTPDDLWVR